jgi:hypothetical protein
VPTIVAVLSFLVCAFFTVRALRTGIAEDLRRLFLELANSACNAMVQTCDRYGDVAEGALSAAGAS